MAVASLPPRPAAPRSDSILPLVVEGLGFRVGDRPLLEGVDLVLEHGPRTVVMGPNGAGKSLLLRLLHGLLVPTEGRVRWAGRPPDRGMRRRQAMVFQRPVLLRRSVAANLRYVLRVHGVRGGEAEAATHAWLERAGLARLARRPARLLSGGEQQLLAMARALCVGPEVLLLDEPTASLDPAATAAIEDLIRRAHAGGTKIVLVTHDRDQALRLADEIVFLHRGRVEERGAAERFATAPRSPAARAFVDGRLVL